MLLTITEDLCCVSQSLVYCVADGEQLTITVNNIQNNIMNPKRQQAYFVALSLWLAKCQCNLTVPKQYARRYRAYIMKTMNPKDRVIIYRDTGDIRMYLCADGTLSGNREHACEHWAMQFDGIVAENPILTGYNCLPGMEEVK